MKKIKKKESVYIYYLNKQVKGGIWNIITNKKLVSYSVGFPILGLHNWTRALQSSPFQNPGGGGTLSVTKNQEEDPTLLFFAVRSSNINQEGDVVYNSVLYIRKVMYCTTQ